VLVSRPFADRRLCGDYGSVGGVEVLPFGLLVFAVGSLLVANVWAVVDTKLAVVSAARDAARVYVEAPSHGAATVRAHQVARDTMREHDRSAERAQVRIDHEGGRPWARCTRVVVTITYRVPALTLPWIGGYGDDLDVRAEHSELVDPFRSGLTGVGTC
jgi:hypothetical protein